MELLIKLILSHFLSDFILQPDSWVKDKNLKKIKSPKLYLHILIYGITTWLIVFDLSFWKQILFLVIAHLIIDIIKTYLNKGPKIRTLFFIDQGIHLTIIFFVWMLTSNKIIDLSILWNYKNLVILTAIIFITKPSSVIIKTIISKWAPIEQSNNSDSLENAGRYIGILERLFVIAFILTNNWEGVGFLLAAKSVFRFGDLKESKDRKLTEYVLIGTLLSYGIAILSGLLVLYLI